MCTYLKAIIHLVSHSRADIFPPPMREVASSIRWAYFGHPDMYVVSLVRAYPEILIPASPDTKLARGFIPARLHKYDREECHVSGTYVHCTKFLARFLSQGCFAPLGPAKARSSVCVCVGGCHLSAPTRHTASTRGLASKPVGQNRVCKSRLGFNPVTGAEFGIASDCHFWGPRLRSRIGEWRFGFARGLSCT